MADHNTISESEPDSDTDIEAVCNTSGIGEDTDRNIDENIDENIDDNIDDDDTTEDIDDDDEDDTDNDDEDDDTDDSWIVADSEAYDEPWCRSECNCTLCSQCNNGVDNWEEQPTDASVMEHIKISAINKMVDELMPEVDNEMFVRGYPMPRL